MDPGGGIRQRNSLLSQKTPVFSNSAFARSSLWAPLQTDEKKILAPCLVNHPHLHFNRSSFKFWEISNNPGTFSEFLQRSDAKILSRISPSRKMICTTMHASLLKENLSSPALKMHSKCWTFFKENWILHDEGLAKGKIELGIKIDALLVDHIQSTWSNLTVHTWIFVAV